MIRPLAAAATITEKTIPFAHTFITFLLEPEARGDSPAEGRAPIVKQGGLHPGAGKKFFAAAAGIPGRGGDVGPLRVEPPVF